MTDAPVNNLHKGEAGEHRTAVLLQRLGFCVAKPLPDRFGVDLVAHSWRAQPSLGALPFYFQVKEHEWDGRAGFPVSTRFLQLAFDSPALLVVSGGTAFANRFRICAPWEWMLDHLSSVRPGMDTATISKSYFRDIVTDSDATALFLSEARRTTGQSLGLRVPQDLRRAVVWTPNRSLSVPFSQMDLFLHFGCLSALEPPVAVLDAVRSITNDRPDLIGVNLQTIRSSPAAYLPEQLTNDPTIQRWLALVRARVSPTRIDEEAREFGRFVQMMRAAADDKPFRMPGFTWKEISAWRIFAEVYPGAMRALRTVLTQPHRWGRGAADGWSLPEVQSAISITASLAFSSDRSVCDDAVALLHHVAHHVGHSNACNTRTEYEFRHQYLFCLAQVDARIYGDACVDFLWRHGVHTGWELQLNRDYYGSLDDSALRRSLHFKLTSPRRRHAPIYRISAFQRQLVDDYGYFSSGI